MKQKLTRISDLPDGSLFYLSKKMMTMYQLQKIEGSTAIYTAIDSQRTYRKPKGTKCIPAEAE